MTPSATPTSSPAPIALPDCAGIYSPEVVTALTAEFREPLGDVSGSEGGGGWGTRDDAVIAVYASIAERISCTWILPASESASTTTIARLDDTSRAAAVAALTTAGFTASANPDGDAYAIEVETEFGSYNEWHLLSSEVWIGSAFSGGSAESLTLDAASRLLP